MLHGSPNSRGVAKNAKRKSYSMLVLKNKCMLDYNQTINASCSLYSNKLKPYSILFQSKKK